eukprot:1737142-Lingulodinium_polyedra.AAC.1
MHEDARRNAAWQRGMARQAEARRLGRTRTAARRGSTRGCQTQPGPMKTGNRTGNGTGGAARHDAT